MLFEDEELKLYHASYLTFERGSRSHGWAVQAGEMKEEYVEKDRKFSLGRHFQKADQESEAGKERPVPHGT
jgi:hypothetical protein